ncbi:MAG: hypothetical protein Q9186_003898 [Xanthomendoza sp. 1 TL-2023]
MQSAIGKATLQSAFLSLCSALVATFLTPKNPPIVALVIFSILATPPNYQWQQYLERKLPGYQVEKREANGEVNGGKLGDGGRVTIKKRLNVTNTLMKVVIDQTLGAVINVALHLGVVRALQGVPLGECLQVVKEQTWPLMIAGYKLWPLVSLLNFTVIPVEQRTVVGSLVGLGGRVAPSAHDIQQYCVLTSLSGGLRDNIPQIEIRFLGHFTRKTSITASTPMASQRPFRARPNLHLSLTQQTGSPRNPNRPVPTSSRFASPFGTPTNSPLAITSYSPYQSAKLKAPSPYGGGAMHFTPRQKHKYRRYCRTALLTVKRVLITRTTWLLLVLVLTMFWWLNGGSEELGVTRVGAAGFGRDFFQDGVTQDMQFFPPSNPKIHYVGRWTPTPNRLRKDGAFPGVYFDMTIKNTTSLLLSLRNTPTHTEDSVAVSKENPSPQISNNGHVSFRPSAANDKPAPPISLLARVDQEEYVLLPNASSLVAVCSGSLQRDTEHRIRIIAPMTDDQGKGIVQLEGIWLSKGGHFERIEGSLINEAYRDEDLSAQSDEVGEKHRTGLGKLLRGSGRGGKVEQQEVLRDENFQDFRDRRKNLEVVTDTPGSFGGRNRGKRSGGADGLLAGVMGWEYLLGEMFGVDHTAIGVDGMCLIQDCIGGVGQPAGLGDIFFRSGPPGSAYADHPWLFNVHIPDVLILNFGNSDKVSFDEHADEYNKTAWDLAERFENTYVSLIKAIRTLAYPQHPSTIQSERSGYSTFVPNSVPASIPIFVMRPLRGELEHATQNIVNRLRTAGDKYVFWLDTSGWLDHSSSLDPAALANQDFYLDDSVMPSKWRLSERGNQRTAIFLHMHVCRYLARDGEKCPFLPSETYEGKVFDPAERDFERYVEGEKEKRLRALFWEEDGGEKLREVQYYLPLLDIFLAIRGTMASNVGSGRLAGKNAIITGAAGGIGLETTVLFLREGASVLMTDVSPNALDSAISKVHSIITVSSTQTLETLRCDVSKESDIAAAVAHVDSWGGVDVMFNNAGIMHADDTDAVDTEEKVWDLTMGINVKGVWWGCKYAVMSMRKHGKKSGSVINTASVVALVGSATPQLAYTASKGAVLALTRELAIVHARENIRFNALCPAPLNTPLLQDFLGTDAAKRHRREIHFPTGRFGEAIEQAHAVLWLASDESIRNTPRPRDPRPRQFRSIIAIGPSPSPSHYLPIAFMGEPDRQGIAEQGGLSMRFTHGFYSYRAAAAAAIELKLFSREREKKDFTKI